MGGLLGLVEDTSPLPHASGPRAELAHRMARLQDARARKDRTLERTASLDVARWLRATGTELDVALRLLRHALALGDARELRDEIVALAVQLGQHDVAAREASMLAEQATGRDASRAYLRAGELFVRAGDAEAAREALRAAATLDPESPLPHEVQGSIALWREGWAEEGARAFLVAAQRRLEAKDAEGAMEDALRALEVCPGHRAAREFCVTWLSERHREGAADHLLFELARLAPAEAMDIHRRRAGAALARGEIPTALAAALDAGMDAALGGPDHEQVGRILERAGLGEWISARLLVQARLLEGAPRATLLLEATRSLAGGIGADLDVAGALIEAVAADPSSQDARLALRVHAEQRHDPFALVEGLLGGAANQLAPREARASCWLELQAAAEGPISDPSLLLAAAEGLAEIGARSSSDLDAVRVRVAPRLALQDEALAQAELDRDSIEGRRRVLSLLRGRPRDVGRAYDVALSLFRELPGESGLLWILERWAARADRTLDLVATIEAVAPSSPRGAAVQLRVAQVGILLRMGDLDGAALSALRLLEEARGHRTAACFALALSAVTARSELRVAGLEGLSASVSAELRAAALSTACLLAAGEGDQARAAALGAQATAADPLSARAVAAGILGLGRERDATTVAVRERAAGVLVLRGDACREQAAIMESLEEAPLALVWTERWHALRPADLSVLEVLVRRAVALPDPRRLGDVCERSLALPVPATSIAPVLSAALGALARRDATRAGRFAARVSERIGHADAELSRAVVSALASSDDGRAMSLAIERRLPHAVGAERAELLATQMGLAAPISDEMASRALLRAVREGMPDEQARSLVSPGWKEGDALLARVEIDAELTSRDERRSKDAAQLYRTLGGLRFDLADDAHGAVRAWLRAAELHPRDGVGTFVTDVVHYLTPTQALAAVRATADQRKAPEDKAFALSLLAQVMARLGRRELSLSVAVEAHELAPSRTDLLALAEHLLAPPETLDAMYRRAARVALGPFGRRAAHYRAARQLERRSAPEAALGHAASAFESVPTLGMPFVLLTRLAERLGAPGIAVDAILAVAEREPDEGARSEWYHRAAGLLRGGEEGARRRVDVLVRAARAVPDRRTVAELGASLGALVSDHGLSVVEAAQTLATLAQEKMRSGEGPSGARVCLAFARAALVSLEAHSLAAEALSRALGHDADLEDYEEFLPYASALVEVSPDLVARCLELNRKPYSNVGAPALKLAARIAEERADDLSLVELLVAAARRAPDEDDLVARAVELALSVGRDDLAKLVDDALPVARRAPALIRLAEKREERGDLPGAIAALEKALAGKPRGKIVEKIDLHLKRLYGAAGLDAPLRDQAERVARRAELAPAERAAAALEAARLADRAGDATGAAEVLLSTLRAGVGSGELVLRLVDAARRSGDDALLVAALEQSLVAPWPTTPRAELLRELAPLLAMRGQGDAARARARELLAEAPGEPEVLVAVEQTGVAVGDYDLVVDTLERRVALSEADEARVLRLRRAAVLEQRLGRLEDARRELLALLEHGEDPTALRFLADIEERCGRASDAARLWSRLAETVEDPRESTEHHVRAAELHLAAGAIDDARAEGERGLARSRVERLLALRVEIEERGGSPRLLGDALDELALSSMASAEDRAALLVRAAQQALVAEDSLVAMTRAQRAARIAPLDPKAQLLARLLEYRGRGAGAPQEAMSTLEELRRVLPRIAPADGPLASFLLAEALDVTSGGGAGMRELGARHAETGPHPLLALGMAERLVRSSSYEGALSLFDEALAGDLHAVRRRGPVALAAAEAAVKAGDPERALGYLLEAQADPSTAAAARQRAAQITPPASLRAPPDGRAELEELARRAVGLDRARLLLRLARLVSKDPGEMTQVETLLLEAHDIAEIDRTLQVEIAAELAGLARREAPSLEAPRVELAVAAVPADEDRRAEAGLASEIVASEIPLAEPRSTEVRSAEVGLAAEALVAQDLPGEDRRSDRPIADIRPTLGPVNIQLAEAERTTLAPPKERITLATALDRALAHPGDVGALEALREAAVADRSEAQARAVEQVLAVFAGLPSPPPPPLAAQREEPEIIVKLLLRGAVHPLFEVVAHVWDHAPHLFRQDPSTYGVSGLDRVSFGGVTPASRVYTLLARMLGTPRTPLFQRRGGGECAAEVALLGQPAVILHGEPREDSPEVAHRLGAALTSATSDRALLVGLPSQRLGALLDAIELAFGPPEHRKRPTPTVAATAEVLWQAIPARAQRRVAELAVLPETLRVDQAVLAASRVAARAGLFASGDFGVSLREAARGHGLLPAAPPDRVRAMLDAMKHPLLYDLYGFALSPEYASARFGARGRTSSGTMRASGRRRG